MSSTIVQNISSQTTEQKEPKPSPPKDIECTRPPLPPPPDPPFRPKRHPIIHVGDADVLRRKGLMEKQKRKATKSGVTEEARKVLEQFLKHSTSQRVRNPHQTYSEREYLDECPYMFLQSNESYYGNSSFLQSGRQFQISKSDQEQYFDEPDYAEPAEPDEEEESEEFEQIPETQEDIDAALGHGHVCKTNSMSSQSSFGVSLRGHATRSQSPSDKFLLSVHPPKIRGKPPKVKGKKVKGVFDDSSSSTEDYEYTENYLVSRKKKSFFKWASERLRQSFRRSHKGPLPPHLRAEFEESPKHSVPTITEQLDETSITVEESSKKKGKKNKLKFNLKRNGSEKGSKSTHSSSTPNEAVAEGQSQVNQEVTQISESESIILRIEETEQVTNLERTERHRKSPVPWKRYEIKTKKKEVPPIDCGPGPSKDKGIFDSFLKHIRKGSSKLKRKGSKDDSVRQRSRSADNLVVRNLSKEHEKVLQRYVTTNKKEVEYDSDSTTVRSFHEVLMHKVDQQVTQSKPSAVWYPPPLPPEPEPPHSDDELCQDGHHSLRKEMHLEGLVPCHTEVVPENVEQFELDYQCTTVEEIIHSRDEDILNEIKEHQRLQLIKPSESEDDVDGGVSHLIRKPRARRFKVPPLDIADKPFHERTDLEKDELYEKIAEQLAAIADQYNFESPRSSKSLSSPTSHTHSRSCSHSHSRSHSHSAPSQSETEEGAVGITEEKVCPLRCSPSNRVLEAQLGLLLRERGDSASEMVPDIPPMMAELVRNASYSKFKQIFNENIGTEPGWQQIAMMFRLTQTAVQLAGFGTAVALQIKEMTLKYFEDKFAGWIVGQGGWESVVEDTENDSELD